jgi:outer membrane protein assembly factor BamB
MTLRYFVSRRGRAAKALSCAAVALVPLASSVPARDKLYVGASPGPRVLRIDVSDGAIEIASGAIATRIEGVGYLPTLNRVLVASGFDSEVFLIDPATGEMVGLASLPSGSATQLPAPRGVAGSTDGRVYIARSELILMIDPATGERREIASATAGSGPLSPYDSIVVETPNTLIVSTRGNSADLYRVNVETGERVLISGAPPESPGAVVGGGVPLGVVYSMVLSPEGDALYMNGRREGNVDGTSGAIVRVDLATGDRSPVSSSVLGQGPNIQTEGGLDFADDGDIISSGGFTGSPFVVRVDVATGNRLLVSGSGMGEGPGFIQPDHVVNLPGENAVLVWDSERQDGLRVDLATGNRNIAATNLVGEGPRFGADADYPGPHYLAEEGAGSLLAIQQYEPTSPPSEFGISKLLRIDKTTGDRMTLVDPSIDGGPPIGFSGAVHVLADGRIILATSDGVPIEVDPVTGARTQIFGNGPPLEKVRGLAADPSTGRLFCIGERKLFRLDPDTGDRETLLDYDAAGFTITARSGAVAADGRVYVVSGLIALRSVVSFDPFLGEFATVYQPKVTSPPPNSGNLEYAMGLSPLGHPVVFRIQINQFARIDPDLGAQIFATESYDRPRPLVIGVHSILLSDDLTLPTRGLVAW